MNEKIQRAFQTFYENRENVVLLWRPHPLIKATIESMRPALWQEYSKIVDEYKKKGYKIMNSVSALKLMKDNKFEKQCWVSNFILPDGTKLTECTGKTAGVCDRCGFGMAAEMRSVFDFKIDTIIAGSKLRM